MATATVSPVNFCTHGHDYLCVISVAAVARVSNTCHRVKYVCSSAGVFACGTRATFVSMPELEEDRLGNGTLRPMSTTGRRLPWAGDGRYRVVEYLCELDWLRPTPRPQLQCPRYIARQQLDRLSALGLRLKSGFEYEFYVVDKAGEPVFDGPDIFSSLALSKIESDLFDLDSQLLQSGIDIHCFNCEYGPGQLELVGRPTDGVRAADDAFVLKEGVKEFFQQRDMQATFMTKPFVKSSSSGLHFNHSLWLADSDDNAFYDETRDDNLSAIAGYWLAGLTTHAAAITALSSPTVNCYRRLHQPWAPHKADWGIDDRDTSFRAKNLGVFGTYVENRIPSSASNPYLVLAATVAAGVDGIVNRIVCAPQRDPKATTLPATLAEALHSLQMDGVMVELLGSEFVEWFVKMKTQTEVKTLSDINIQKDDNLLLEKELYFTYL